MNRKHLLLIMILALVFIISGCKADDKKESEPAPEISWTNGEKIYLWDDEADVPYFDESIDQDMASITPYIAESNEDGKAVILIPGGGYAVRTDLATEIEIATELNANNISAFILDYRVAPYDKDAYMTDAFRAIRTVRYYAESFGIDSSKITVMGLSAGGHLSIMTMEHYDEDLEVTGDAIDKLSARPDAGVLCYPVSSFKDDYTHEKSRMNFLGEDNQYDSELQEKYSGECGVTEDTPPAFIWHTQNDQAVPYESSELLKEAFDAAGVECELHLYKYGSHGLGLAKDIEGAGEWFANCMEWLDKIYE